MGGELEKGIKKALGRFGRNDSIEQMYRTDSNRYNEATQKLIQSAIIHNNELKEKEEFSKIEALNQLLAEDFDTFLVKVQSELFGRKPILHLINFTYFNDAFRKLVNDGENHTLMKLRNLVTSRYGRDLSRFIEEKNFLENLSEAVSTRINNDPTLTNEMLRWIQEAIIREDGSS